MNIFSHTLREEKVGVLSILLIFLACLFTTPPARGELSDTSPRAWVESSWGMWDDVGTTHRITLTQLWTLWGRTETLPVLRDCASAEDTENELRLACLAAMSGLGDSQQAPLVRDILRTHDEPQLVGMSARILAAFKDHFSRDLILLELLNGKGGYHGSKALMRAFSALRGSWEPMYLSYTSVVHPNPSIRVLAAAYAYGRVQTFYGHELKAVLESFLKSWITTPCPTAEDMELAEAALSTLRRRKHGCANLSSWLTPALENVHGAVKGRVDELITALNGACWRVLPKPDYEKFRDAACPDRPPGLEVTATPEPPPWRERMKRLTEASGRTGSDQILDAVSDATERRATTKRVDCRPWDEHDISALTRSVNAYRPPHPDAPIPHEVIIPEDIHGFTNWLKQPDWYPEHIHITIDDGPRLPFLPGILEVLGQHQVKATFFFVGAALARRWLAHPEQTRSLLQRVVSDGHDIGFHSMNHVTKPSQHIRVWEADQVADSVTLYRKVLGQVLGETYPVRFGRLPGGMGMRWPSVKRAFFKAGLFEHVHWNAGPPVWVSRTPTWVVRDLACKYATRNRPVVVLLHEYKALARHLDVFLDTVRTQCPQNETPNLLVGVRKEWTR